MKRLRDALLVCEQAAAEAMTLTELGENAIVPLAAAFQAHVAAWYRVHDSGVPEGDVAGIPDAMQAYAEFAPDDPLQAMKRRLNPSVAVTTALVDRRAFMRSAAYNDFFVRIDVEHQLCARLSPVGYGVPGCTGIVFGRAARQKDWQRNEIAALERVLPSLRSAARRCARIAQAGERAITVAQILEHESRGGYLVFGGGGEPLWQSARGQALVASFLGGVLPEDLLARVRRVARLARSRELADEPTPLQLDAIGSRGRLRGEIFVVHDPLTARVRVVVRIDEDAVLVSAVDQVARDARLTPAERNMLEALSQGKSNADIARAYFISTETVRTHVQRILRKLGVKSRLEAAVKVRDVAASAS